MRFRAQSGQPTKAFGFALSGHTCHFWLLGIYAELRFDREPPMKVR